MNVLDHATLTTATLDGWQVPQDRYDRSGAVSIAVVPICADPQPEPVQLMPGDGERCFRTAPIVVQGRLSGITRNAQEDDPDFLDAAVRERLDLAVGAALVTEPLAGASADAVWIGHEDAAAVEFVGNALADGNGLADVIVEARQVWIRRVLGKPALHLSPSLVPGLLRSMLLRVDAAGELRTVLGDAVVVSAGYGFADRPVAFWAGPLAVTVSTVAQSGAVYNSRQNQVTQAADLVAVIEVAPFSLVRVDITP